MKAVNKETLRSRFWFSTLKSEDVNDALIVLKGLEPKLEYVVIGQETFYEFKGRYHHCVLIYKDRPYLTAIPNIFKKVKCHRIEFVGAGERKATLKENIDYVCRDGVMMEYGVCPMLAVPNSAFLPCKRKRKCVTTMIPPAKKIYIDQPSYSLREIQTLSDLKFSTAVTDYSLIFKELPPVSTIDESQRTGNILNQLVRDVTSGFHSDDLVQLTLRSVQLNYPIGLTFMPMNKLNGQCLHTQIKSIVQSDEKFSLTGPFLFQVNHQRVLPKDISSVNNKFTSISEESCVGDISEFSCEM